MTYNSTSRYALVVGCSHHCCCSLCALGIMSGPAQYDALAYLQSVHILPTFKDLGVEYPGPISEQSSFVIPNAPRTEFLSSPRLYSSRRPRSKRGSTRRALKPSGPKNHNFQKEKGPRVLRAAKVPHAMPLESSYLGDLSAVFTEAAMRETAELRVTQPGLPERFATVIKLMLFSFYKDLFLAWNFVPRLLRLQQEFATRSTFTLKVSLIA